MTYKLLVSDIDGVWTDGSFYYSKEGDSYRRFSTKDSYGVALATIVNLPVLILSGEDNEMVKQRLQKLGVKNYFLGVQNKIEVLKKFCSEKGIAMKEVAFLGDDMNDYGFLEAVGLFACPKDGYPLIKERAHLVLNSAGGNGAFREFVETILEKDKLLDQAYAEYLSGNAG